MQTSKMADLLCTNDSRHNKSLPFHCFPREAKRRADWIVKIKRDPGPQFQVGSN